MITTPNRKKRSRSEQARIHQRAKESQTHLSGNQIYNTWQQLKYERTCKTDSSFAAYLISLELKRREK